MSTTNYHFSIGAFDCIAISDGSQTRPADSIIKDMPLDQWRAALAERGYSTEESVLFANVLFVRTGQRNVLFDAGWGQGAGRQEGSLIDGLAAEGIGPSDVDLMVITHGDADHVSGILDTENRAVYRNATYVLSQEAWDFWANEDVVAKLPERFTRFGRAILPLIRDRVRVVGAGEGVVPGMQLISAPGHRAGHTVVEMVSRGEHLFHLADTVGHPVLMEHPSWPWSFDARPDVAARDKTELLGRAAALGALVFAAHLPFPGVGRVVPQGDGWRWQPVGEA